MQLSIEFFANFEEYKGVGRNVSNKKSNNVTLDCDATPILKTM